MRTCTVYFYRPGTRHPLGAHVTAARSVFEAARVALDWFEDPFWKGARPDADTILEVQLIGRPDVWYVRAGQVADKP